MKKRFTYILTAVLLVISSGCGNNNPVSPGPHIYQHTILNAEGVVYGTPVSFHDSTLSTAFTFDYSYTGYGGSGLGLHLPDKDVFRLSAISDQNGYKLNIEIQQGEGSIVPGVYNTTFDYGRAHYYDSLLSVSEPNEPSNAVENKKLIASDVVFTTVIPYTDIEGNFTLKWFYKYDTTRTASIHGTFIFN